jgi:putative addiction module component (TIGR02574 family)
MDIQSLGIAERILLAEKLWESVRAEYDHIQLTPEQAELLESRLSALESDGEQGDSWEHVRTRIMGLT